MAKNKEKATTKVPKGIGRMVELLEWLLVLELYINSKLDHHAIAERLNIGTQRVSAILKGIEKNKH